MPIKTFKTIATKKEGLAVELESRGLKMILDEPKESGGTNLGMNPVEGLLGCLGACQTIVASMFAKEFNIDLKDFWVEVEGDIDTDSFIGKEGVEKGYQAIRFHFHIKSDATKEKTEKFIDFIEDTCPVGITLQKGVKFEKTKITMEK